MDDKFVKTICKPGTSECCRYLAMDKDGWDCLKNTSLKSLLDERVKLGTINAVGDNCPGR